MMKLAINRSSGMTNSHTPRTTAARLDRPYLRLLRVQSKQQKHAALPPSREIGYVNVMKNRNPSGALSNG